MHLELDCKLEATIGSNLENILGSNLGNDLRLDLDWQLLIRGSRLDNEWDSLLDSHSQEVEADYKQDTIRDPSFRLDHKGTEHRI